jgi:flavin reductase (DIM6/NTAB) family NADH-FMN oxidoreductase RutF
VRRPWNIPDLPVYSLVTCTGGRLNMNICTYVSAISMKPKQYLIAVYKDTKTLDNLMAGSTAVLQLLHRSQSGLVNVLGKKSGRNTDKQKYLERKNALITWNENKVLSDACAWVELKPAGKTEIGGDHVLFYFDVIRFKTNSDKSCLMVSTLISEGRILG